MINKIQQETFLREFFRNTDPMESLNDGDPRYVRLYHDPDHDEADPVKALRNVIDWSSEQSAQLFSGFRGTGKSTELRRLAKILNDVPRDGSSYAVFFCDMQQHMNMTTAVEISDFLISMAGAFGEQVQADLGEKVLDTSYYTRAVEFLTRTKVTDLAFDPGVGLKANLKDDPTVRARVQRHLSGHLAALTREVHEHMHDVVQKVRKATGKKQVVLILDSIEQVSGVGADAQRVFDSVVELFRGQADKLRVPHLHVVYTVPPWLDYKAPGVKGLYSGAFQLPCVRVRNKDGTPNAEGVTSMRAVVKRRGDWEDLLGDDPALLDTLVLASGGYLRDLLRLVQGALRAGRYTTLPLSDAQRHRVVVNLQNDMRKLSTRDQQVLAEVHASKSAKFDDDQYVPSLSRLFDNHLVLNYRNGEEWIDAHPLLWEILPAPKPKTTPDPT